jgi:hypothetical protein
VPEHLRAQSREIASIGIFFGAGQALGVLRSHLLSIDFNCFARGLAGRLSSNQRRETVEAMSEVARPIAASVRVGPIIRRWEEQHQAAAEGENPVPGEGVPQQPPQE